MAESEVRLRSLERLGSLERLSSLGRLSSLERLQYLENLRRVEGEAALNRYYPFYSRYWPYLYPAQIKYPYAIIDSIN